MASALFELEKIKATRTQTLVQLLHMLNDNVHRPVTHLSRLNYGEKVEKRE